MLHLLGVKLHPAVGILLGVAMVAIAITTAAPILGFVGALVVLMTVWMRIESSKRDDEPTGSEDRDRS
jgi:hypothetical protein